MQVLHLRCAGLDGHKDSVGAAVRIGGPDGGSVKVRRFGTTPALLALGEWLAAAGVTEAATQASGRLTDRHRFLLRLHPGQHDALAKALEASDAEAERDPGPFRDAVRPLCSIPGASDLSAAVIVAEIGGGDRRSATGHMSRFPAAGHLISRAGLRPRNDESAGKRRGTRLRKGAPRPKTTLVQRAWAASRRKDGYLRLRFQRLCPPQPERGRLRRRCLHPLRHLASAARLRLLARPRHTPLPHASARTARKAPRPANRRVRFRLPTDSHQ